MKNVGRRVDAANEKMWNDVRPTAQQQSDDANGRPVGGDVVADAAAGEHVADVGSRREIATLGCGDDGGGGGGVVTDHPKNSESTGVVTNPVRLNKRQRKKRRREADALAAAAISAAALEAVNAVALVPAGEVEQRGAAGMHAADLEDYELFLALDAGTADVALEAVKCEADTLATSPMQFDGMCADHIAEDRIESKGVAATGGGARMAVASAGTLAAMVVVTGGCKSESLVSSYQKSCGDKFGRFPKTVHVRMVTTMAVAMVLLVLVVFVCTRVADAPVVLLAALVIVAATTTVVSMYGPKVQTEVAACDAAAANNNGVGVETVVASCDAATAINNEALVETVVAEVGDAIDSAAEVGEAALVIVAVSDPNNEVEAACNAAVT